MTDYTQDPDVALMLAFQKGDKRSFELLMQKYYPKVLNFIYRYGLSSQAAEDLTQEVFLKIHQSAGSYRPQAKFQTLLFTITRNLTLNAIRDNRKYAVSLNAEGDSPDSGSLQDTIADAGPSALDEMMDNEKAQKIKEIIAALPENQRCAVMLRRYENLNYEEIAKTMNCSVMAVKSLLNRAKETLKVQLADLMNDEK